MRPRPFRPHYVGHNATTRVPRRFIWLDTEARQNETETGFAQRWRLAVTAFDDRDPHRRTVHETEWEVHRDPAELWAYVSSKTKKKTRTVLYAHNLGYDLRIAAAMIHLPALGWRCDLLRIDGRTCWMRWRRESATLMLCDSFDWLPIRLETVGGLVGVDKLPLPDHRGPDAEWVARCKSDVFIMREAMLRIIDWLELRDLGNWQPTAAGTAWSTFRHRFMDDRILVHGDEAARVAERRACWTGRCEAWRWGRVGGGRLEEWDMRRAYPTIARDAMLPVRLVGLHGPLSGPQLARLLLRRAVLAEVEVTTERPLVPAEVEGRIAWPVGSFRTVLWDPELRLLEREGAQVDVRRAWSYATAPALSRWAKWVLSLSDGHRDGQDPILALVAKGWSRSLIGRFALRYPTWEPFGRAEEPGLELTKGHRGDDREPFRMLQVGHEVMIEEGTTDGRDAVPSIVGWIMSECRVRLWEAMVAVGLDRVLYVDTDSVIVRTRGPEDREHVAGLLGRRGFTLKVHHRSLQVLGPHQLISGGELKAAGVPRGARMTAAGKWEALVWELLPTALSHGRADEVVIKGRSVVLRGTDRRRRHLANGRTAPVSLALGREAWESSLRVGRT